VNARANEYLINSLINEWSKLFELPLALFLDHDPILIKIRVLTKSDRWSSAVKKAESCDPRVSWHHKVLEIWAQIMVNFPVLVITNIFEFLLNVILRRNGQIMLIIIVCWLNITI
jgi:hypothetical protein